MRGGTDWVSQRGHAQRLGPSRPLQSDWTSCQEKFIIDCALPTATFLPSQLCAQVGALLTNQFMLLKPSAHLSAETGLPCFKRSQHLTHSTI